MDQVSPIGVLPQASYIEYVPTGEKELDYKTLFSLEQQRATALYKQQQQQINNRIKIQGNIDKLYTDPNSPLSMVGDNDMQRGILDGVRADVQPLINEYNALQASPNYDENAVLNLESKISQKLFTNNEFRKVIEDKAKFGIHSKGMASYDPEDWESYQDSYYGWDGKGENPLNGFNPANMLPFDENKYNNALKGINTSMEGIGMYNQIERKGQILKDPAEFKTDIDRLWQTQKRHLVKQGYDYDSWYTAQYNNYYNGSGLLDDGTTHFRITDGLTAAQYKDATGDDTTAAAKKKKGESDGTPYIVSANGMVVVPNAISNNYDGRIAGTQSIVNETFINPVNERAINKESNAEYQQQFKGTLAANRQIEKQYGTDQSKFPQSVLEEYNNNKRTIAKLGEDMKRIQQRDVELKGDAFYKSPEYKAYLNGQPGTSGEQIAYGLGLVSKEEGKFLDGMSKELFKTDNMVMAHLKGEKLFMDLPKTIAERLVYIDKLKADAIKSGVKNTKIFDDYKEYTQRGEAGAYQKYSENNNLNPATGSTIAFTPNPEDPDAKPLINAFNGKSGHDVMRNSKSIKYANGTAYRPKDGEMVRVENFIYDKNKGEFVIKALTGVPKSTKNSNDQEVFTKDSAGNLTYDKSDDIFIADPNVNQSVLNTALFDTPNGANTAERLFPHMAKTVDVKEGKTTGFDTSAGKFKITSLPNGRYSFIDPDNVTSIAPNRMDLVRAITSYTNKKSIPQEVVNTTNTSGGGNMGKPQTLQKYDENNIMSVMAEQSETKGAKQPYKTISSSSTNAFGKYQFVPSAQGDRILDYVKEHPELMDHSQNKYNDDMVSWLRTKFGRDAKAKGYSDDELAAYVVMLDNPRLQDGYANDVLMNKDYKPNIDKVISAYSKNGVKINEAQAIDIMHHYGVGNAKKGDNKQYTARKWANGFSTENNKDTEDVNNRINNYNFTFQGDKSMKNVNTSLVDSVKHLVIKAGLDTLGPMVSSTKRNNGGKSAHDHGNAIDFKFKTQVQELEAIDKISNLTDDPKAVKAMLLKGKGTNGYNIPPFEIKIKATGQKLKIIYHADSDGNGNHLHIAI